MYATTRHSRFFHGPNLKLIPALTSWMLSEALVLGKTAAWKIDRLRSEAEIIVLDLGRPIRRKRIFKTGAGGPAGPRQARACRRAANRVQAIVIVRKGDAAFAVDQQAIEGGADAAGHRRSPLRVGVDRIADASRGRWP